MKNNTSLFMGLLICCLACSGCIYVVAGTVGALGGYAISKDTIQGDTDRTFDSLWNSSLEVLDIMGNVNSEDKKEGKIEAKIDTSRVKISIEQLTAKTLRMRVSARKYFMPNITLAQKIYIKIIERCKK